MVKKEQLAQLTNALRTGASIESACRLAKIDGASLKQEMKNNTALALDVVAAIADGEMEFLDTLRNAAIEKGDWRAAAWWLERRGKGFAKDAQPEDNSSGPIRLIIEKKQPALSENAEQNDD